jgi:hypothetical protein
LEGQASVGRLCERCRVVAIAASDYDRPWGCSSCSCLEIFWTLFCRYTATSFTVQQEAHTDAYTVNRCSIVFSELVSRMFRAGIHGVSAINTIYDALESAFETYQISSSCSYVQDSTILLSQYLVCSDHARFKFLMFLSQGIRCAGHCSLLDERGNKFDVVP